MCREQAPYTGYKAFLHLKDSEPLLRVGVGQEWAQAMEEYYQAYQVSLLDKKAGEPAKQYFALFHLKDLIANPQLGLKHTSLPKPNFKPVLDKSGLNVFSPVSTEHQEEQKGEGEDKQEHKEETIQEQKEEAAKLRAELWTELCGFLDVDLKAVSTITIAELKKKFHDLQGHIGDCFHPQ